jgi:hypothetical protein
MGDVGLDVLYVINGFIESFRPLQGVDQALLLLQIQFLCGFHRIFSP